MYKYYPMFLGITEKLNEWNEKLSKFAQKNMDNVGFGTAIFFAILLVTFWAIGELNKRNR